MYTEIKRKHKVRLRGMEFIFTGENVNEVITKWREYEVKLMSVETIITQPAS